MPNLRLLMRAPRALLGAPRGRRPPAATPCWAAPPAVPAFFRPSVATRLGSAAVGPRRGPPQPSPDPWSPIALARAGPTTRRARRRRRGCACAAGASKMDQGSQKEFFAEATESQRYRLTEVIGKGSYGVVASAVDQFTGGRPCCSFLLFSQGLSSWAHAASLWLGCAAAAACLWEAASLCLAQHWVDLFFCCIVSGTCSVWLRCPRASAAGSVSR